MSVERTERTGEKKLALIRRGYSPTGGAEKFLSRFAIAAKDAGRSVVLVNDRPWPKEALHGIPQQTLGAKGPWAFAKAVEQWKKGWEDGLVFSFERVFSADCYRAGDGVHAAWLSRRAVYDPWWEVWMRRVLPKQRQLLELESHCFSARDTGAVIVNSQMVGEEIEKYFRYPKARVHLVRNGLPEDFASGVIERREARSKMGLEERDFIAAFAGTGWKRKGLRFAIDAMAKAGLAHGTLIVAGRGAEKKHTASGVRFLGPQKDVRPILAAADVFILPTVYDPFSNACLEALAMGCPVITTRANGCSEVIVEGVSGSIVAEPHDVEGLATALRYWASYSGKVSSACIATAEKCTLTENVKRSLAILDGLSA